MNTYKFLVSICGGWCNGHLIVDAPNDEIASDIAMEEVGRKLTEAFPELDIPYDVELCEEE